MRVLLVTSEVTYVPHNYIQLFSKLLEKAPHTVWGLMILKNLNLSLLKSVLGLTAIGAPKIRNTLLSNILHLPLRERERLFSKMNKKVFHAKTMNDPEVLSLVKTNQIDLIINVRTRCIYKKEILEAPRLGCLNIHHGLLPHYRGTMCDLYALSEKRPAGFTLHKMNERIDDGEILELGVVDASGTEKNYVHYLAKGATQEGELLANFLINLEKTAVLPKGISNKTKTETEIKVYTRNPDRKKVQEMLAQGMIL